MASYHGRARISARYPEASAICDRCGALYNRVRLDWQMEWAGPKLVNKRLLVCRSCMDEPNPVLRTRVIPADPLPIQDPRFDDPAASQNVLATESGDAITTEAGNPLEPEGNP